ncbi:MAG: hypothetical protein ACRD4R_06820 [Candidatus Acidiferrales bacterium]
MPGIIYVAEQRVGMKKKIGPASYLHDFLISHQTSADGRINYGKVVTYG